MIAVARREFLAFFRLPLGWVVAALIASLSGAVVAIGILEPGRPASMRPFFIVAVHLLLPTVPAISMRLFSEEARTGTIESLLATPVGSVSLVVGKFLGGWLFLLASLAPTVLLAAVVAISATPAPDPGPIVAGYLALASLGALYLAVGLGVSALTDSQTLAYLGAFILLLTLIVATSILPSMLPDPWASWVAAMSLTERIADASKGVIDLSDQVFFAGWAAVFLTGAAGIVEVRRCR